jgi:glycosyltransferase involved in cell wall biosynthesis
MRIAQIPPLYESVPPRLYGGTERVVAFLCDALVELGHDVTLFSSADSQTKARLHVVRDQALRLDTAPLKSDLAAHLTQLADARSLVERFDVLHFHIDLIHFPVFEALADRCITTLHGRLDCKDLDRAYRRWRQFGLVSISNQQRAPLPQASWLGTVPHGLPFGRFGLNPRPGQYLAFLGRMSPEKAPDAAIRIALRAGVPLKMAAKVDAVDEEYFNKVVRPLLRHPLIEFVGEIGEREKAAFLGNAMALIFPIRWPEPFGLVMIEAMACGTPVVAFEAGAVREVVEDGVTGFVVRDEQEALVALSRLPGVARRAVRRAFEARFTARRMAHDYLQLYEELGGRERLRIARVS